MPAGGSPSSLFSGTRLDYSVPYRFMAPLWETKKKEEALTDMTSLRKLEKRTLR